MKSEADVGLVQAKGAQRLERGGVSAKTPAKEAGVVMLGEGLSGR